MRRALWSLLVTFSVLSGAQTNGPAPKAEASSITPGVRAKDATFHSASLDRDMRYRILLPRGYEGGTTHFPVLYLLHGLYGDYLNWDTRTGLERYAENLPIIVVMPDAGNSWYTNSARDPRDKFEDYLAKDVIAEIDSKYRTVRGRNGRAIAGLSMGGYAAIKLALKYPDSFIVAGSLSGALDAAGELDGRVAQFHDQLVRVYGPAGDETRRDNDVFLLVEGVATSRLPYLYLACGEQDEYFVMTNHRFIERLSARKITYEYHETSGAHQWDYWDRSLRLMLPLIAAKFSNSIEFAPLTK